ncbi:MAG: hypothetical protein A2571_02055 [Candidatus Vogelbacteria bacterium RIFOXYD1_FULL_44_32]|uniref:TrbC/VIRB2 family protein n=1 Tax=Candidatus Vogelbacteria bacterium RIFOXYD1_FULL_44_32 TaxID=1802438 RepID=A0A1G2QDF6_9BACT|nr:MAG: hypothetical protein A2571_02055 [Candidatus Vogelbacteria bacterium RIFOXYD1_FULL_44_32]
MIKISKIIFGQVCLGLLGLSILVGAQIPAVALAAETPSKFIICGQTEDNCNFDNLKQLVNIVIEFVIFELAMPIAVIAIMYAGFLFVFHGDQSGERQKAISIFKNMGIGLVLMLAAYIIVKAVVVGLVGSSPASGVGQSLLNLFRQ